jgi:hypothetical protein
MVVWIPGKEIDKTLATVSSFRQTAPDIPHSWIGSPNYGLGGASD